MMDRRNPIGSVPRGKRQQLTVRFDWGLPLGRQMLDRTVRNGEFDRLLRMTLKRARGRDGFHKASSGIAAAILDLLRDEDLRREFTKIVKLSPESFRSDEECARFLAIGFMFGDLAGKLDAIANRRLAKFERERKLERRLRELSGDFDEDADWHARKAAGHLNAVEIAHGFVRYVALSIERDFGVRAPRLVAEFTNRAFEMTPKMSERQARYLCSW
jgi:hypothetical protein